MSGPINGRLRFKLKGARKQRLRQEIHLLKSTDYILERMTPNSLKVTALSPFYIESLIRDLNQLDLRSGPDTCIWEALFQTKKEAGFLIQKPWNFHLSKI